VLERKNLIKTRYSSQTTRKLDQKCGQTTSIRKDNSTNYFQQLFPLHLLQHHLHPEIALNLLESKRHAQLSFTGNHLVAYVWLQLDSWHSSLKSLKRSSSCLHFSKCVLMALNQQNLNFSKPRTKITKLNEVITFVGVTHHLHHA